MDLIDLGRIAYDAAWNRQRELVERRAREAVPDTILLCEHPHVVTRGRARRGAKDDAREVLPGPEGPVPVFRIERGGQDTYHGPGQLVAYPVVRLDRVRRGLDGFLRDLEEAVIRTAADFDVAAVRNPGATGVWVPRDDDPGTHGLKLASIGIAVRRWITYHGLALNVNTDLRYFRLIRPCGFDPDVMTSLAALRGAPVSFDRAKSRLASHLTGILATA
jgi:lipoyl(octanoyl) transferase